MENEVWLIDMHTLWQCETCFHHYPNGCDTYCDHGEAYRPAADQLTVIDPETLRPKGRWELQEYDWSEAWKCSACGEEWCFEQDPTEPTTRVNYCPNCGVKMEG